MCLQFTVSIINRCAIISFCSIYHVDSGVFCYDTCKQSHGLFQETMVWYSQTYENFRGLLDKLSEIAHDKLIYVPYLLSLKRVPVSSFP